ncbi:3-oxoadipate enol-lactonase [Luedemannella helvata]|uniref:3-oxoadipate enol-lactonase n=1 Tax=Luedemannella helvata TaxID=349315 RepID=A0ABP4WLA2_9ACTN
MILHHVVDGPADAPVLLLGGSLGSDVSLWAAPARALSQRYRIVRFDHRGHGLSPVPSGDYEIADLGRDVLALLDHLGVPRAHYAGLSLGGMVGMWLAAHAPERVDRLALACTAAFLPPAQGWLDRASAVRGGGLAAIADAVLSRWVTPGVDPGPGPRAMLLGTPPDGYAACCAAIAAMDLRPALPRIAAPTLVIAAAEDLATPPVLGAEIAASVPGARYAVVADAAHVAVLQRPDEVTDLIARHLAGDPVGDAAAIPAASRHAAGMAVRRAVLGDAHVDRATARADAFTADFQDLITRYAWGEVWTRDGLSRRERSLITLAMLAALRCEDELAMHVRAALRQGLTPDEIREVLLQVAIYAGVPAANAAFAIAARTLASIGKEPHDT